MKKRQEIIRDNRQKAEKMREAIRKNAKVSSTLPQYKGQVFKFKRVLSGIFNDNAAELEDSNGEVVVLPLEKLVLTK